MEWSISYTKPLISGGNVIFKFSQIPSVNPDHTSSGRMAAVSENALNLPGFPLRTVRLAAKFYNFVKQIFDSP